MAENQRQSSRKEEQERMYQRSKMQKEMIVKKLNEKGLRLTRQRNLILDVILEHDCACCKEIYYKASELDEKIGTATVYRLVNVLEEIGAISRKNRYKVAYTEHFTKEEDCVIVMEDQTRYNLSGKAWHAVVKAGLKSCGYSTGKDIASIMMRKQ